MTFSQQVSSGGKEAPAPVYSSPAITPEMSREERQMHYVAHQLALGPLGDPAVTEMKFRRDPTSTEIGNNIPMEASIAESTNPWAIWDVQVLDTVGTFSGSDAFTSLVNSYRSGLTEDERVAIDLEEEQITLGEQREKEIWEMELAARDRKLAAELAAADAATPQDVFVAEGFDEQRAA